MATKQTFSSAVARRYAHAFIETANESKATKPIEKDLAELQAMIDGSDDLKKVIYSPLFSRDQQINTMKAIAEAAKLHDLTSNFLMLLAQNRRLDQLQSIISESQAVLSTQRGEILAQISVAKALDEKEEDNLKSEIAKSLGHEVKLSVHVDKDLIGGMIIIIGSKMIDDSVKRKLERLKLAMKSGANTNAKMVKAS